MAKTLKTPASLWSLVFRRIVQQLENDERIHRVVGPNLRSWKGVPADRADFVPTSSAPVLRLTPYPREVDWYSADSQAGWVAIEIEIALQSLNIDDVVDLWDLVVQALAPGGSSLLTGSNFSQDLVALGAETGHIVFSDPAFDPRPAAEPEGFFLASGRLRVKVVRPINP